MCAEQLGIRRLQETEQRDPRLGIGFGGGRGLSAVSRPPINSTNPLLMASPKPVPPYSRAMEDSAWTKG